MSEPLTKQEKEYRERQEMYRELARQRRYAEKADMQYENLGRDSDAAYEEWANS